MIIEKAYLKKCLSANGVSHICSATNPVTSTLQSDIGKFAVLNCWVGWDFAVMPEFKLSWYLAKPYNKNLLVAISNKNNSYKNNVSLKSSKFKPSFLVGPAQGYFSK